MQILKKGNVLIEVSEKNQYRVINSVDVSNLIKQTVKDSESNVAKIYRKKITLNGLGYKCNIISPNLLSFKLNLSHPLEISVPSYITKVSQKKKFIVFESPDKVMLSVFLDKIYNLRPSDAYKFKGFYLESKPKIMKEVNKKNKKG